MHKTPTQIEIGLDKISPSALDCFEQCPKLFYYQNWLGIKLDEDKLHMDFGNAIHAAIEVVYLEYDNHFGGGWQAGSFEPVQKRFLEHWRQDHVKERTFENYMETRAGKESGFKNKEDLYRYMKADGIAILKSYWEEKEKMLVDYNHDLVDFELYRKIELHNPEDPSDALPIPLSMRLDAMTRDKTKIVDFKTSKNEYDEVESRNKIQGQCYLFAHLMETGNFISKFDYIVLRKGLKSSERVEVVQLEYDMADMNAFYARVKAILVKIAQRQFDRPIKGHNNWCNCLKYEEALSVKEIQLIV